MKKCHFIGIGGIGMSGLARIMLTKKMEVSGSDIASSTVTEMLEKAGAKIHIGHSEMHVDPDMAVVYTTDIKKDNPEYQAALRHRCQMLHRSELLQQLLKNYQALAVAGTHGKTTTSSLLTWVLQSSGLAPSYAIGGVVPQLQSNAGTGDGKHFILEACESDGTFTRYTPYGAIVTNIDFDHMDYYSNKKKLIDSFKKFIDQVASSEHLFWCGDDPLLRSINPPGISYGLRENCKLRLSNFTQDQWKICFDITFAGKAYHGVEVALCGKHNALNAAAVFGMALSLGIEEEKIRKALISFGGVLRRCEKKGESHGILMIDDYAHHPTELKATIKAIRNAIGERRMVAIYQPHRYTRAKDCMGQYRGVFSEVDELFVTEIYAAREEPIPGVTHENIIDEIQQDLHQRCRHVPRKDAAERLGEFLRPHDVLVTLGAGDVTKISGEVLGRFKLKAPAKLKLGLIFGGMSVEHRVSLLSADYIRTALRAEYYDVENFAITYQGQWIKGPDAHHIVQEVDKHATLPKMSLEIFTSINNCDLLFPMLHGTCGEDGTIQGFFEMLSKPYVGCDHRSAAISMDKVATKKLVQEAGIPIVPYVAITHHEWLNQQEELLKRIENELRYPLFVKPIHLGSSIGVHKVTDTQQLIKSIEDAFRLDTQIIIENGIEMRELEFAVIGNDEILVYPPAEVKTGGEMQEYHAKYGMNGVKAVEAVPNVELSPELIKTGMDLVKRAYKAVGCCGLSRIDTFLDCDGKFWLNEINPMPGCTKHSLFPQICAANGLSAPDLVDKLVILAMQRKRQQDRLERNYG